MHTHINWGQCQRCILRVENSIVATVFDSFCIRSICTACQWCSLRYLCFEAHAFVHKWTSLCLFIGLRILSPIGENTWLTFNTQQAVNLNTTQICFSFSQLMSSKWFSSPSYGINVFRRDRERINAIKFYSGLKQFGVTVWTKWNAASLYYMQWLLRFFCMTKSRQTECQMRTALQKAQAVVYFYLVIFFYKLFRNTCASSLLACDVQGCAVNREGCIENRIKIWGSLLPTLMLRTTREAGKDEHGSF